MLHNYIINLRIKQNNQHQCTINQKKKKRKKKNTPIYFKTNYRTEMKQIPIIMDYCLLQFDALKFF